MSAEILRANARSLPLADDSVDLIVTSPPYFALRSYTDSGVHYRGQIGSEPTPAEFIASLLEVTRECVRVLKPSGSLFVNLGDKYALNNRGSGYARGEKSHQS
jgi:DNA modification methylase